MRPNKEIEDQINALVVELYGNDQQRFETKLLSLRDVNPKDVQKALVDRRKDTQDAILCMQHYVHWSRERQSIAKRIRLFYVKHKITPDREHFYPQAFDEEY